MEKTEKLYEDAYTIIRRSIAANLPQAAVRDALKTRRFTGTLSLVAIGKAAWTMALAAKAELGDRITSGIVITKYGHAEHPIPGLEIIEAGHPISDENTLLGTARALDLARGLGKDDELLFLISGGGSALFEKPLEGIGLSDLAAINTRLLASGADIVEINMIRKRLSAVKAGRFAQICEPARVFTVVLSDVLGDRLDSIASGPAAPDLSTADDALRVVDKYGLPIDRRIREYLMRETPKSLGNVETVITGSVRTLCESAARCAADLGYTPYILCTDMNGEAREAGRLMAAMARHIGEGHGSIQPPCAVILGGETVVRLKGAGKGGRNQELALAAAAGIAGLENLVVFSVGSDGTDGPTDAAGGIVDGTTLSRLREQGLALEDILDNNDSYRGLEAVNGLIKTGPTGTNVNDIAVILHQPPAVSYAASDGPPAAGGQPPAVS
ncbi:MAG: glycerate kinase [Spirochaetaceae bacterium]|nr:glycerate kinase [Spirochaetaceae bacterium]